MLAALAVVRSPFFSENLPNHRHSHSHAGVDWLGCRLQSQPSVRCFGWSGRVRPFPCNPGWLVPLLLTLACLCRALEHYLP